MRHCHTVRPVPDADDLLTTTEVAEKYRVNRATVVRWLNNGQLTGIKVGPRTYRYRRADVEALLQPESEKAS